MLRGCLFVGMVAGWGLAGASLYVVRSANGVNLVTKDSLSFTDTYADIRTWSKDDLPRHGALVARLIASDHQDLISDLPDHPPKSEASDHDAPKHHKHSRSHHSDVALNE